MPPKYASTRLSMPGNVTFYERLGYRVTGTEPHKKGPDIIVWFEKELPAVVAGQQTFGAG